MNYRHDFHAGNFADLIKHAVLIRLLGAGAGAPRTIIDTHAGAGLYLVGGEAALRTGEQAAGLGVLMQAPELPPVLGALRDTVRARNPGAGLELYPGSSVLVADRLRRGDRLIACEVNPSEAARLRTALAGTGADIRVADGFEVLSGMTATAGAIAIVDPPFERSDDYERSADAVTTWLGGRGDAMAMIWTPIKDLETLDRFVRRLEARRAPGMLVVETRIRPLTDPMRMNGSALVILNAPPALDADLAQASAWVAAHCGEAGAAARVWRPDGLE